MVGNRLATENEIDKALKTIVLPEIPNTDSASSLVRTLSGIKPLRSQKPKSKLPIEEIEETQSILNELSSDEEEDDDENQLDDCDEDDEEEEEEEEKI
jgi:hypothetical protein